MVVGKIDAKQADGAKEMHLLYPSMGQWVGPIRPAWAAIVNNMDRIKQELGDQATAINKQENSLKQLKSDMVRQGDSLKKDVRADMEQAHTSNFMPALVGLVLVAFGTSISTLAPEIYYFLS